MPLDKKDEVVRPAKLWCDTSTAEQCEQIRGRNSAAAAGLIKLAGNAMLPGYTAPKILWLKQNEPKNFTRRSRPSCCRTITSISTSPA